MMYFIFIPFKPIPLQPRPQCKQHLPQREAENSKQATANTLASSAVTTPWSATHRSTWGLYGPLFNSLG